LASTSGRNPNECRWGLPKRFFKGPRYRIAKGGELDPDKASLRMQVYEMFPQKLVLDLFAGKGLLSQLYAPHCRKIICVEKNPELFKALKRNMKRFSQKAILINDDNMNFLADLPRILRNIGEKTITFVDFDPYGCPTPQIQNFFDVYQPKQNVAIALTDGILLNFRTWSSADLRRYYLQDFYVDLGAKYSKDDRYHVTRKLGEYLFQIQKNFIDILCMRHDLQAHPLYFKVKKSNTVVYSAYLIMPKLIGVTDFKKYAGIMTRVEIDEQEDPNSQHDSSRRRVLHNRLHSSR